MATHVVPLRKDHRQLIRAVREDSLPLVPTAPFKAGILFYGGES